MKLLLPLLLLVTPVITHGQPLSKIPSSLEHQAQKAYDSGFIEQAISILKKALKLDPNNPRILTNMGTALNELNLIK